MAAFNATFARKEVKYKLSAQQLEGIIAALSEKMAPDAYGYTQIVSTYYDTPQYALIARSLEKPLYKEKLRVRSYGEAQPQDRVFVEIKKKSKGIVYKRRVDLSAQAAQAYLQGMDFDEASERYPIAVPDPEPTEDAAPAKPVDPEKERAAQYQRSQIAAEIDAFTERNAPLSPSAKISCTRCAWTELEPEEGSELRVTFDTNLTYQDLRAGKHATAKPIIAADEAIMEIKNSGSLPLWLVDALSGLQILPSSFSKYGEAYKRICSSSNPTTLKGAQNA